MRRHSEAVEADVRRRMGQPHRQSVAQISAELGIHVITLYKWRKTWRLQGEEVPASQKDPKQGLLEVTLRAAPLAGFRQPSSLGNPLMS